VAAVRPRLFGVRSPSERLSSAEIIRLAENHAIRSPPSSPDEGGHFPMVAGLSAARFLASLNFLDDPILYRGHMPAVRALGGVANEANVFNGSANRDWQLKLRPTMFTRLAHSHLLVMSVLGWTEGSRYGHKLRLPSLRGTVT
jgi:hypothetical protein